MTDKDALGIAALNAFAKNVRAQANKLPTGENALALGILLAVASVAEAAAETVKELEGEEQ